MQALENGMTLLDAFPFDSSPNLVYTNQGYPRGDRAVDAWTMRHTFRQFFSTGVFGTPADAFEISKGTGLSVVIQPGMCVIEGGMGGISEKSGPLTLTLGTGPAQGKTPYGIMLRYDDNSDVRGITVYAKKGTPGDNPTPPEPDTESANVHELRLGYVIVPNGASDLSEATVTNEKGLAVCPYAAPFAEIDMSQVTEDAKATAIAALDSLMAYFEQYREMVDAAVDETLAGQLQEQINQLKEKLDNFDLSTSVDNKTIEYTQDFGQLAKVLSVMDGGITTAKLDDGSVTTAKLGSDVAIYISSLTKPQIGKSIGAYTWDELVSIASNPDVTSESLAYLIGQIRQVVIDGYGSIPLRCIGIRHDDLAQQAGKAALTLMTDGILFKNAFKESGISADGGWENSTIREKLNSTTIQAIDEQVKSLIVPVSKKYSPYGTTVTTSEDKLFLLSRTEVLGGSPPYNEPDGEIYDYWSQNNFAEARVKSFQGKDLQWWLRSRGGSGVDATYLITKSGFDNVGTSGNSTNQGIVVCFCLGSYTA